MYRTWALCLALLPLTAAAAGAEDKSRLADAFALEQAMMEAIQKAEPAIASIRVWRREAPRDSTPERPDDVPESYGSGVVIDEKGLILTNLHVVREATKILVRLPGGKSSSAEIHAGDPRSDLAVLRLEPRVLPVKALKLGDGGAVRKGQFVLSLANPFAAGYRDGSPSASWGIISNLRRRAPGKIAAEIGARSLHQFGTLMQLDARLNLGCSGGAVLDLKGELIGLTTALAAITGGETPGGYAVPLDAGIRRIVEVLKRGEEVEYGFLGVSPSLPRDGELRPTEGVRLDSVVPGSPAFYANLSPGNGAVSIVKVNGTTIREPDDLFVALGTVLAGSSAQLEVADRPGGPTRLVSVTLAKFYVQGKVIATKRPEAIGGLRVDYASILYQKLGSPVFLRAIPEGVMIREVVPGSPADSARLQEDKIIREVNGHKVSTPDEFYREMRMAAGTVDLTVANTDGPPYAVKLDLK
jgi:serine protease Do